MSKAKRTSPSYQIERIAQHHVVDTFDCGEESMNDYLAIHAQSNAAIGFGVTYVLLPADSARVVGYYTLTAASMIRKQVFSSKKRWGLPPYDIPVVRLARLAVDNAMQGQGLGGLLLWDALQRALVWSQEIGAHGVDVHAINQAAVDFYLKYGFEPLLDHSAHLFLPMETIRAAQAANN